MTKAVLFDVDFTLIYPGPTFRGEGYQAFAARHGIEIDSSRFDDAVVRSAHLLDGPEDAPYNADIFIAYTSRIIQEMGGRGPRVDACSKEIYDAWAACQHFELYEDVPLVLRTLASAGIRIGLISNTQRCLASFQSHFELEGLITGTVSSFEHGYMKPHPSIFNAALNRVGARPDEAVMVGDSIRQDIEGALRAGLRAILLHRGEKPPARANELGVPVIKSLTELPPLL